MSMYPPPPQQPRPTPPLGRGLRVVMGIGAAITGVLMLLVTVLATAVVATGDRTNAVTLPFGYAFVLLLGGLSWLLLRHGRRDVDAVTAYTASLGSTYPTPPPPGSVPPAAPPAPREV